MFCGGPCVQCGCTHVFILVCFVYILKSVGVYVDSRLWVLRAYMVGLCALGVVPCMGPFVWCGNSDLCMLGYNLCMSMGLCVY